MVARVPHTYYKMGPKEEDLNAESFNVVFNEWGDQELKSWKKHFCCCGATKTHPCACMIQGIETCSATCPCSLEKKGAETSNTKDDEKANDLLNKIISFCWVKFDMKNYSSSCNTHKRWLDEQVRNTTWGGELYDYGRTTDKKLFYSKAHGIPESNLKYTKSYEYDDTVHYSLTQDSIDKVKSYEQRVRNYFKNQTIRLDVAGGDYKRPLIFIVSVEKESFDGKSFGAENKGAESWSGDPKGKLAVALQKARDKSKEPRKPLKIEKLDAETSFGSYSCSNCGGKMSATHYECSDCGYAYGAETFEGIPKSVSDLESLEDVRADKYEMEVNFENEDIVIISGGELKAIIDDGWYLDSVRSFADAGMSLLFTRNPYHKAETSGQWEIGEQLEEAQMNAEIDGEELIASSANFNDGSMMVGVGTETLDVDNPDFMEMMIDKDGKIEYFTLPIGLDGWDRHYNVKPSHYGKMKTQNETNESIGGDFIRTDGDGKYAESFSTEGKSFVCDACEETLPN